MAQDGIIRTEHSVDSTTPSLPGLIIHPRFFRETEQKTSRAMVDHTADQIQGFSTGQFDGRFWSSYPGTTQLMEAPDGSFYHIVGTSVGCDMSVAAP